MDINMNIRPAQEAAKIALDSGMAKAQIATRVGTTQATISRILSGEHTDPKGSILIALNKLADEISTSTES